MSSRRNLTLAEKNELKYNNIEIVNPLDQESQQETIYQSAYQGLENSNLVIFDSDSESVRSAITHNQLTEQYGNEVEINDDIMIKLKEIINNYYNVKINSNFYNYNFTPIHQHILSSLNDQNLNIQNLVDSYNQNIESLVDPTQSEIIWDFSLPNVLRLSITFLGVSASFYISYKILKQFLKQNSNKIDNQKIISEVIDKAGNSEFLNKFFKFLFKRNESNTQFKYAIPAMLSYFILRLFKK